MVLFKHFSDNFSGQSKIGTIREDSKQTKKKIPRTKALSRKRELEKVNKPLIKII